MAGEEELRARAVLAEMQMRISQGPHAALSVAESASPEEIRTAFLELTKQFHPARFGRMSNDVHRLANEVFLGIKSAHDRLLRTLLGGTGRFAPVHRAGSAPRTGGVPVQSDSGGTVRGTGLVPRSQQPLGRGTDRPGTRPSTPMMTTPSGGTPRPQTPVSPAIPRTMTPNTTPTGGTRIGPPPARPATPQVTQPLPRSMTPPAGVSLPRPGSPVNEPGDRNYGGSLDRRSYSEIPNDYAERKTTPASGIPAQRPTPASGIPIQRTTPAGGIPVQRPTSPLPTTRTRTPAPEIVTPPTVRYSGVQPAQSGSMPRQGASDEDHELRHGLNLLSSKDWSAARLAFHALAAKVPQSRQYRALLCYARGRETQSSGRPDDAVMEFQRALQLDPDLEIAKDAIRELQRKSRF